MNNNLKLDLDRTAKVSLTEQIRIGVATAIETGVLEPGARLPSWQDLASQLGVARGTVRLAYEKLAAAQLIEAARAKGTRVAPRPRRSANSDPRPDEGSFLRTYQDMTRGPAFFQMGIPAADIFPAALFARTLASAARAATSAPPLYPDPRGEIELRKEIAGYLAVSRGINCQPSQVIITGGFSAGLGLTLMVLGLAGQKAWIEDPCFPWSRKALELGRLRVAPIPVDDDGIDIDYAFHHHPDAKLVVLTPGQQAPLGPTLSLERRLRLLDWAATNDAWVVEDDYLGELQLSGTAAPALASLDREGRVIHIGSFSKTISPNIRLGYVVIPAGQTSRFVDVAACLAPAPGPTVQLATAEFMSEGHYMRHLRRTKRAYSARRLALVECLQTIAPPESVSSAGLAALLKLPPEVSDIAVVREATAFGMSPSPLSYWYSSTNTAQSGLLLGAATSPPQSLEAFCDRLLNIVQRVRSTS